MCPCQLHQLNTHSSQLAQPIQSCILQCSLQFLGIRLQQLLQFSSHRLWHRCLLGKLQQYSPVQWSPCRITSKPPTLSNKVPSFEYPCHQTLKEKYKAKMLSTKNQARSQIVPIPSKWWCGIEPRTTASPRSKTNSEHMAHLRPRAPSRCQPGCHRTPFPKQFPRLYSPTISASQLICAIMIS